MAELIFEVPDKLKQRIDELPSAEWKSFLRKAVELKAFELELQRSSDLRLLLLKSLTSKSKLSEKEAEKFSLELGKKLKEGRYKQLKKMRLV